MGESGLKQLTIDNWQEPDPVVSAFVRLSPQDGAIRALSGDDWARGFLAIELSDRVPLEVRRPFDVARGALVYGYFFYPLYTLGAEQLFRAAEAAIRHKCREVGVSDTTLNKPDFYHRTRALVREGAISHADQDRWDDLRELRNLASHPEDQSIFSPGIAIGALRRVAADVEGLFSG
jgi:hypothetical protein